ncbi:hypothetical protein G7075_00360 [Phycicoccus sp. HDW14]|uniref:hypothetical protein n=1 Tax=Phycicoccus sp. HDW14 TaxID=2714941 RepID=UPI00140A9DFD|nr:hypothetical protein [Phycicoccus sp. HDW14]QIM19942.1 hypothetical protein G7075_00360 [Phycicoccus sp. HDW14]
MSPAHATAQGERQPRRTATPPPDTAGTDAAEAPAEQRRTADEQRLARLRRARQDVGWAADARLAEELTAARRVHLRDTAVAVADILSDLARDDDFWAEIDSAQNAATRLSGARLSDVQQILQSDLTALLDVMGYTDPPPPPGAELAVEMQVAFHAVVFGADVERDGLVGHRVQHRMLDYVFHLQRLVREVDAVAQVASEADGRTRRLVVALRDGVRAIGPAAVAAGVTATLFPPAAVGAAGALAVAGVDAGMKAAVGQGAQLGAAALMDQALNRGHRTSSPDEAFATVLWPFVGALDTASLVVEHLLSERTDAALDETRAYVLDAMHWSFELDRAMSRQPGRTWTPSALLAARAVQRELVALRDWLDDDPDFEVLEDISDRLARGADLFYRRVA